MNKRIKKKREWLDLLKLVAQLQKANDLQQEVIEDYGRQIGDLKRRVAELEKVGGCNALACNNRFDQLEKELEEVRVENKKLRKEPKTKRSWFGRN